MSNKSSNVNTKKTNGKAKMSTDTKRLIIVVSFIAAIIAIAVVIMALTGVFSGNNNGADNGSSSSSSSSGSSGSSTDAWFDENGGITLPPIDVDPDDISPGD